MSEEAVTETETTTETTEATATETKAAETTATTETTTEAPAFDYGKWAEGLADATKKDYAKRFKNLDEVIDGALAMRKDVAARIKVPGKDAKPEDVAAFHKAIGADPDPAKYEVAAPEGVELGDVDKAFLSAAQQIAAENGVPVEVFKAQAGEHFKLLSQIQEKVASEVKQFQQDSEKRLKSEHGKDFDTRIIAGNSLIDKLDKTGELRGFLNDTITWNGVSMRAGDHPAILHLTAELGLRMGEDGVLVGNSPDDQKAIDKQISELENKYPLGQRTREQDQEIQALYRKRYGSS